MARWMFGLVEPIGVIPLLSRRTDEGPFTLGFTKYWEPTSPDGRRPLGVASAEVVDAVFYNLAPGEVAVTLQCWSRVVCPNNARPARSLDGAYVGVDVAAQTVLLRHQSSAQ